MEETIKAQKRFWDEVASIGKDDLVLTGGNPSAVKEYGNKGYDNIMIYDSENGLLINDEEEIARRKVEDICLYLYSNLMKATSVAWFLFTGQRNGFCRTPDYIKNEKDARRYIDEWNLKVDEAVSLSEKHHFVWFTNYVSEAIRNIRTFRFDSFEQSFEKMEDL